MRDPKRSKLVASAIAVALALAVSCSGPMTKPSALAGQWHGQLVVSGGESTEVILDLTRLSDRWVGQFDLPKYGVEDYPVRVVLEGDRVTLDLTAAEINFSGELERSGRLAGIARVRARRDPLVFQRTGDAVLSQEFLALEAVAEDSTGVHRLAADAGELRRQFNSDRSQTRLLMLLSPT